MNNCEIPQEYVDKKWWAQEGSNLSPPGYEPGALPTELWALIKSQGICLSCKG